MICQVFGIIAFALSQERLRVSKNLHVSQVALHASGDKGTTQSAQCPPPGVKPTLLAPVRVH